MVTGCREFGSTVLPAHTWGAVVCHLSVGGRPLCMSLSLGEMNATALSWSPVSVVCKATSVGLQRGVKL